MAPFENSFRISAMSELSVFHGALEITDPQARAAFLDQACAGDTALRRRIEDLLQAHVLTAPFMSRPAAELLGEPVGVQPRTVIAGRYTLIEPIGHGGMGEVWVAEQSEPVKRRVAVKLIKAGMDSSAVIARFEAERQALALMDHPNIAKVHDGGLTDRGRPFFVMELVNGLPLTRYCDEAKLTPRERLELFVPICQAVQHAHQKGIVHRDLKPSNLLVTLYDGRPVPKVIDFGVAKATGGKLTENSPTTQFGTVVGTLEYMAPEQAGFSALDVDTRADIYSLGIILYELLTGLKPFDTTRLNKAAIDEVLRIIREEDPPRPSTRLSTDDALPSLAAIRQTEPKRLTALMRGELDWVVMKCLEKDRTRRYETANALGRDVQRFLADEVVEARPPSRAYRLRKFGRKHQAALWTSATIAALLVAGIVGTTWEMIRARNSEAHTRKLLTQLENSNDVITSIFTDVDIEEVRNGDEPLEAALARGLIRAAAQLDGEAIGDPQVVARLQHRLGESLMSLGYPREAIPLLTKALETRRAGRGIDHEDTLSTMNQLAESYRGAGELKQAEALHKETLALAEARLGAGHMLALESKNNLALTYHADGKPKEAVPLFEEVLKYMTIAPGERHKDTLRTMNNLALAHDAAKRPDLAVPIHLKTLNLRKEVLGVDHSDTISSMSNLGEAYYSMRDIQEALKYLKPANALAAKRLGSRHINTLTTMNALALALQADAKALQVDRNPDLAKQILAVFELVRAKQLFEEALKGFRARLGPNHQYVLRGKFNLARCYLACNDLTGALQQFKEAWEMAPALLRPDDTRRIGIAVYLAEGYLATNQPAQAVPILKETLGHTRDNLERTWQTHLLALAYHRSGQINEAERLVRDLVRRLEELKKTDEAREWMQKFPDMFKDRPTPEVAPTLRPEIAPLPPAIKPVNPNDH